MRTLVDIPDEDIEKLDALAGRGNRSRAAIIREAVRRYLADNNGNDWIARGAGYWREDDAGSLGACEPSPREDRALD